MSKQSLSGVLTYNLDGDRLETELRKFVLIRKIDSQDYNLSKEEELSENVRDYFGGRFNSKINQVLQEGENSGVVTQQVKVLKVTVIANSVWPQEGGASGFPNPHKEKPISPALTALFNPFSEAYKEKFKNRKVKLQPMFG